MVDQDLQQEVVCMQHQGHQETTAMMLDYQWSKTDVHGLSYSYTLA